MMDMIVNLITSYEGEISTVEELITTAYQATLAGEGSFSALGEEREALVASLQKVLARNCSLRRKDFNRLIRQVLADSDGKRQQVEEEWNGILKKVKNYLDEQKQLAIRLRQHLVEPVLEKTDHYSLDLVIRRMKTSCEDVGQQLFAMLRDLQLRLVAFQREEEDMNRRLQSLIDRGESLRIEDLRQMPASVTLAGREENRVRSNVVAAPSLQAVTFKGAGS